MRLMTQCYASYHCIINIYCNRRPTMQGRDFRQLKYMQVYACTGFSPVIEYFTQYYMLDMYSAQVQSLRSIECILSDNIFVSYNSIINTYYNRRPRVERRDFRQWVNAQGCMHERDFLELQKRFKIYYTLHMYSVYELTSSNIECSLSNYLLCHTIVQSMLSVAETIVPGRDFRWQAIRKSA